MTSVTLLLVQQGLTEEELPKLVDELTGKFRGVLESLVIDVDNDPNSHDTARRLAKMYVYELILEPGFTRDDIQILR